MLLEFTVGNFTSFYKKRTLSMMAQSIKEEPESNVVKAHGYNTLRTLAVYGANSSGKSNLLRAIDEMFDLVEGSVKLNDNDKLRYSPFRLLKDKGVGEPTLFEVIFIKDKTKYRYGFKYNESAIVEEWLFRSLGKTKREATLFLRDKDGIGVHKTNFPEGKGKEESTNDNRLFLSLCGQLGGQVSKSIVTWFVSGFNVLSGIDSVGYGAFSKDLFYTEDDGCEDAQRFLRNLQLGFENVAARKEDEGIIIDTIHNKYDTKGNVIGEAHFDLNKYESEGTKKIFDLSGPISDTLSRGATILIDELDAKMHPLISMYIIGLFNSPKTNPKNAQLIFTTHDTNLLSSNLLRRDQIWFTEKDQMEQTDLYCLMDIVFPDGTKPRKDSNYEKNYINGRYGAIPFIAND